jgi:hypothetical protein
MDNGGFRFFISMFFILHNLCVINFVISMNPVSFGTILKVNQCGSSHFAGSAVLLGGAAIRYVANALNNFN